MLENFKITVETEIVPEEMNGVVKGLTDYNASKAGGEMPNYLFITVRADDGAVTGGLIGATYLGWLQVQVVWVDDTLRGSGLGATLMQKAEEEAVRRGCPRVFVETLSFQALPFYEKCGYTVFSRLPDFPPGGCRYALTKTLDSGTAS